jgi:hypothetical protein
MSETDGQNGTPHPPEPATPQPGGPGEFFAVEGHQRADAMMLQRFPIPPETRLLMVGKMREIMVGSDKPRNRIMATKTLAMLDKMNMEQEKRILGIPDTIVNVIQQVNVMQHELGMMDASILTPAQAAQAALAAIGLKQDGNGSNGNGNGNGNGSG